MSPVTNENLGRGRRSVLLGSFVLFQVIYLPLSNLVQFIPRHIPPQAGELDIRVQREGAATNNRLIQEAINSVGAAIDRYGEFSGQGQAWSLFAPDFGKQSLFASFATEWVNGPFIQRITTWPQHAPEDPADYFRWPNTDSRLRAYEFLLTGIYWHFDADSLAAHPMEWRQEIAGRVRQQQGSLGAFFRCELERARKQFPDRPMPTAIIMRVDIYPSPKPGVTDRLPSYTMPLARWQPAIQPPPGILSIEAYDPVAKQFVRLRGEEDGQ